MKNIFYIHGFASSSNSSTITKLKEYLDDANVIGLDYDSSKDFHINLESLINQVDSYHFDDFMFIGTSLGGLYAKFLSDHFKVSAILINPVVEPSTQLKQFVGKNANFKTGESFTFSNSCLNTYKNVYTTNQHSDLIVYSSVCDNTIKNGFELVKQHVKDCLIIPTMTEHRINSLNELPDFKRHVYEVYDDVGCQLNM